MKFCKKCQTETERYAAGGCKPCIKKRSFECYYGTASPKIKLTTTQKAANSKAWYLANKDHRQRYERSAARKAQKAARYAANPEKYKLAVAGWKKANPEAKRIQNNNRRAKELKLGGKLSKGLAKKLFVLQKGKCACCKQPLGNDHHLDHIMPLALGGTNTDDNMQLLRQQCNNQKHAKHPVDFMQSRGFLL